ncbi:hypothetical protein DICVIV_03643 [Dictyocaulus viviparus]|uniref:Uncharacterized protein n=1 Tax=Dictyocaulus viviparus TaxID=29172 RepID=A0A0D8Y2G7_DICVI|nr:hypothetical protein DICVIV_03643 [Dictyocaulus viviparus]
MISSAPFIVQLKIYLTLTISIAVERVLALYLPVTFRRLSSSSYAFVCLLFGLSLGSIDLLLEFTLSKFARVPNCPTVGCLLSPSFLTYWGISNMVMGVIVICLTTSILLKLRIIQQQSQTKRIVMNSEGNKFKQANRICGGILIVSLMFVTLPSIIVGIIEMMVASTFGVLGPFYIAGLLCAGTCNSVLYVVLNKDIRVLARKALCGKQLIPAASVSTI